MKKVLFVATVVKTHIMEFHIPYLKMFQDMGWETAVAADGLWLARWGLGAAVGLWELLRIRKRKVLI